MTNKLKRGAGVLCHISTLPGKYGVGSIGGDACRFAKLLAKNKVKYWQILPLAQTGFGDSPYQAVSCSSGNPYFIDLDLLAKDDLLTKEELKAARSTEIDYAALYASRYPLLRTAFSRFNFDGKNFRAYVKSGAAEDYALFMTAKVVYGGTFSDWPEAIKRRNKDALEEMRTEYHEEYLFWNFLQYEFHKQWMALKKHCKGLGVKIIGEIPLLCAYDSADVWAHPELFKLDEELRPAKIAGVPPDYFSSTGQRWGYPVYDWAAHEKDGYAWWKARLNDALQMYDVVRIGHFVGLDRCYELPADAESAEGGEFAEGPKEKIFAGINCAGRVIAEDLGAAGDGVKEILKKTGIPGSKVLLFAFDGKEDNEFLPHLYGENCVCYTATHDSDTVSGFVGSMNAEEYFLFRSRFAAELEACGVLVRLGDEGEGIPEAFIRLALASKANLAIIPIQDILRLDSEARMNLPGTAEGNWRFRLSRQPSAFTMGRLKKMIKFYRR